MVTGGADSRAAASTAQSPKQPKVGETKVGEQERACPISDLQVRRTSAESAAARYYACIS